MKIAIADDHEIFRDGLHVLLTSRPDTQVVLTANSGAELLALLQDTPVDLVILDQFMPGGSGLDFLRESATLSPRPKVILLTGSESSAILAEAKSLGANGIVSKQGSADNILKAIEAISLGEFFVSKELEGQLSKETILAQLTNREMEVLLKIVEGHSTRTIAEQLGVSFKTAETHRTRVMGKLDLHSVVELMEFAREWDLLSSS